MFHIVSPLFSSKPQQPKKISTSKNSMDHQHPVQDVTQIPTQSTQDDEQDALSGSLAETPY